MRLSQLFGKTLREIPSEAEDTSYELLLRAGFIRAVNPGTYSMLPLGRMVVKRIEQLIHEHMELIGGQEIRLPLICPANVSKDKGYSDTPKNEKVRFQDRFGREFFLTQSRNDVLAGLVRSEIQSYRQLPIIVYQLQTRIREDFNLHTSLIKQKESTTLDSYSLGGNESDLDTALQVHLKVFQNIFQIYDLPVTLILSKNDGLSAGSSNQFMYLTPVGDETLFFCSHCDYKANSATATFKKQIPPSENMLAIKKVATPGMKSIEELSKYLKVAKDKTAKAVFLMADLIDDDQPQFVFTLIRGDTNLSESKLLRAVKYMTKKEVLRLRPAIDTEIISIGAVPGYASPLSIKRESVLLIVDDLIPISANLVVGANLEDYHLLNINYERDFTADLVTDLACAEEGSLCPHCGSPMQAEKAVEVARLHKFGISISEKMSCSYLAHDGTSKFVSMGSYNISLDRLLHCVVEEHHDENGLLWPISIAPFQIHLIMLASSDGTCLEFAENLYQQLCDNSLCPLFDDRDERAGVKFNDADLIGLPIRITISERTLSKKCVEFKRRDQKDRREIPISEILRTLRTEIHEMNTCQSFPEP